MSWSVSISPSSRHQQMHTLSQLATSFFYSQLNKLYQLNKPRDGFTGCSSCPGSGSTAWNKWHPLVPWDQGNFSRWGNRIATDLPSKRVESEPQMSTRHDFHGFHQERAWGGDSGLNTHQQMEHHSCVLEVQLPL